MSEQKNILTEAEAIITGPRQEPYGSAKESFERVATMWSVLLKTPVTAQQVAHCMIALKLAREVNQHHRDNLVDICGYAALAERIAT